MIGFTSCIDTVAFSFRCFLSSDAQHAADIILCILQCALDFEACCSGVIREAKLDRECSILPPTLVEKVFKFSHKAYYI